MTEQSVEPASVEPAGVEAPPADEPAGADKPATEGAAKESPGAGQAPADNWEHFGPPPVKAPGRLTRIARRTGRILGHEWTLAVLGALLLAAAMHWRSLAHPTDTIPADLGDPTLQAWQLAWSGHAVLTDPTHLWNANAFFPAVGVLLRTLSPNFALTIE